MIRTLHCRSSRAAVLCILTTALPPDMVALTAIAHRPLLLIIAAMITCGVPALAHAQEPKPDVTALAKETQNPVAGLISLPFQFNFNTGGDLEGRTFFNLNFQPVIPFKVTQHWNVIARTIVPVDSFPAPDGTRYNGVGDIQEQVFFTPAQSGAIIWGVGPSFSFPSATALPAETGTWAAGPAAVVVKMTGPFVLGGLVSQLWPLSDAGEEPEMNLFTVQPFVNYNFGQGWALGFAPVITANWDGPDGNEWTVPLGLGLARTTVFNRRPLTVGITYYSNVERPDGAAAQQLRFVVTLLYPR